MTRQLDDSPFTSVRPSPFNFVGEISDPLFLPFREGVGQIFPHPGLLRHLEIMDRVARLKRLSEEALDLRCDIHDADRDIVDLKSDRNRRQKRRKIAKIDRWIGRVEAEQARRRARLAVIYPEIEELEADPDVEEMVERHREEEMARRRREFEEVERMGRLLLPPRLARPRPAVGGPNRQARRADAAKSRRRSA